MAACSLAALCELLWANSAWQKKKSRNKRKPKLTEPEATVGTLVCACMPGVQSVSSSGLENGLDHASLPEQMNPCPRHSEGFQAEGDG